MQLSDCCAVYFTFTAYFTFAAAKRHFPATKRRIRHASAP